MISLLISTLINIHKIFFLFLCWNLNIIIIIIIILILLLDGQDNSSYKKFDFRHLLK